MGFGTNHRGEPMPALRSVEDHQQAVAALFAPPEAVKVAVADALGLVAAVDVRTRVSLPGNRFSL